VVGYGFIVFETKIEIGQGFSLETATLLKRCLVQFIFMIINQMIKREDRDELYKVIVKGSR
jgi:hypothetical protein